jgi:hypothetical protein
MFRLNCRWMEKLMLLLSGGRVVSEPCHQLTLAPLDTDGFMNGGAVHAGIPFFIRNVGWIPFVWLGKLWVKVNPMVCAEPVTAISSAKERA